MTKFPKPNISVQSIHKLIFHIIKIKLAITVYGIVNNRRHKLGGGDISVQLTN